MNPVIVDNVNNLSGAPVVARDIARCLGAPIVCIRQADDACYSAAVAGVRANRAVFYFLGILALLFKPGFLRRFRRADTIVCNTSLTFCFAMLARLFAKRTITVLHESAAKNLLYRVSLPMAIRAGHVLVTPSRKAYESLNIPQRKWRVIPNCLGAEYFDDCASVESSSDELRVLFIHGGRPYKGAQLFAEVRRLAAERGLAQLQFHSTADPDFAARFQFDGRLRPEIYGRFHVVLILTDNRLWRETFGLVGFEAAACRCVPVATDRFAYRELWEPVDPVLNVDRYDAGAVLERLATLAERRPFLDELRERVRRHALEICDIARFESAWRQALDPALTTGESA